jgi:hypothetical protein
VFWDSFKSTFSAVLQIVLLGAVGYVAVRKNLFEQTHQALETVSKLVIYLALPCFITSQLFGEFDFARYPHWWIFPLLSFGITALGILIGRLLAVFLTGADVRSQFVNLTAFQNGGYLVLALITALFPQQQADVLLVYLALFLLGFNLAIFSVGLYLMSSAGRVVRWRSMVNPPVVAITASLVLVASGAHNFLPRFVMEPVRMIGHCTLPLALFVVGGNLAQLSFERVDKRAMVLLIAGKLILIPSVVLWLVLVLKLPYLIGAFLVMEAAVPPATTLSVIMRHERKPDVLISQGLFYGHLAALVTVPIFLSMYFTLAVVQ